MAGLYEGIDGKLYATDGGGPINLTTLKPCPDCGGKCRPEEFGGTHSHLKVVTLWICANAKIRGGNCPDENAYLSADIWNARTADAPTERMSPKEFFEQGGFEPPEHAEGHGELRASVIEECARKVETRPMLFALSTEETIRRGLAKAVRDLASDEPKTMNRNGYRKVSPPISLEHVSTERLICEMDWRYPGSGAILRKSIQEQSNANN